MHLFVCIHSQNGCISLQFSKGANKFGLNSNCTIFQFFFLPGCSYFQCYYGRSDLTHDHPFLIEVPTILGCVSEKQNLPCFPSQVPCISGTCKKTAPIINDKSEHAGKEEEIEEGEGEENDENQVNKSLFCPE